MRSAAPKAWFLSGIGSGGRAEDALRAGARADGSGCWWWLPDYRGRRRSWHGSLACGRDKPQSGVSTGTEQSPAGRKNEEEALKKAGRRSYHYRLFRLGDFTSRAAKEPLLCRPARLISDPGSSLAGEAYALLARDCSFTGWRNPRCGTSLPPPLV